MPAPPRLKPVSIDDGATASLTYVLREAGDVNKTQR